MYDTAKSRDRLQLLGLPVFKTLEDFALLTHVQAARLYAISYYSSRFYKKFVMFKKAGGIRVIYQPSKEVKAVQAWILRNILDQLSPSFYATAFQKGLTLSANVTPHEANRYFVCLDIEDFFPSINSGQVYRVFLLAGYEHEAAHHLSNICTCGRLLPQGGVTSPALSNLICARLDRRLAGYTARRNITYTRYADDMTFSSNNRNILNKSIPMFLDIIRDEEFEPNLNKTRVMGPKTRCQITGLVKNSSSPQFGIGKRKKREMRAVMYNLVKKNIVHAQYKTEEAILGWLSFVNGVDTESYKQMKRYWDNLH